MKDSEIIERLKDGWELGSSIFGLRIRTWMQKGGLGRGGETVSVSYSARDRLIAKGLIVSAAKQPGDICLRRFCLPNQKADPAAVVGGSASSELLDSEPLTEN